jgi:hypothetical protein
MGSIGKFADVAGAIGGAMVIWTFLRRSSVWALGLTKRKKIANRMKTIQLLDELHSDASKLQSYVAARVFDILAILGAALMLMLLTASGSSGVTVAAVFIGSVGAVIYSMGLAQSMLMNRLRTYERSRAELCEQIERLGGEAPCLDI